jgi:23S rRNA pseudouridine2605 synthase
MQGSLAVAANFIMLASAARSGHLQQRFKYHDWMVHKVATRRIGLARALSKLGYCSRSRAAELIRSGRVRLNAAVRRDPEFAVDLVRDRITIEGRPVEVQGKIYLIMNKPRGLVTTASDEKGRETIYSLFGDADEMPWVAPVGRLDKASEGLLLLTNDSEWGARVASPQTHLKKTYHVQIATIADERLLKSLTSGVRAEDGDLFRANRVRILRSGEKNCWLEIVLDEGKNRHIRRMLQAIGIEVLRLVRVAIGSLELGELPKGSYRQLTSEERQSLNRIMKNPQTAKAAKVHEGRPRRAL